MFYLVHIPTGRLANQGCTGEHDARATASFSDALGFSSWGDASDFSQNFGPDWTVEGDPDA